MSKSLNYNRQPFDHGYQRPTSKPYGAQWDKSYKKHVKALGSRLDAQSVSDEIPVACDSWSFEALSPKVQALIVRRDDDCWGWLGETYENSDYPKMWDAKAFRERGMRRVVYEAFTGTRRPKMARLHMACGDGGCLNPEHMRKAGE